MLDSMVDKQEALNELLEVTEMMHTLRRGMEQATQRGDKTLWHVLLLEQTRLQKQRQALADTLLEKEER